MDFIGDLTASSIGGLSANCATGLLLDASIASSMGLTYDHMGEYEQLGMASASGLVAEAIFSEAIFEATISAAPMGLDAESTRGYIFNASIASSSGLIAESLYGGLFNSTVASTSGLSANTITGLELDAVLASVCGLDAMCTAAIIPEITTGWSINLATGGHARYTGALDGSEMVNAYFLTGVTDFSIPQIKTVPDAYLYARINGGIRVTRITDEQDIYESNEITDDGKMGMHRFRDKGPKGMRGNSWQFRVDNIQGADFTIDSMEVMPLASKSRISR